MNEHKPPSPFAVNKAADSDEAVRLKEEQRGEMDLDWYERYRAVGREMDRRVMGGRGGEFGVLVSGTRRRKREERRGEGWRS